MLIIFGFRIRFSSTGELTFFCPVCGGDRHGQRRKARRWFTIFWIPVLPLNNVGDVVECDTCHTRFEPEVGDQPTTADLTQILANATRVLTAMVVRAGDADDATMRAAAVATVASSDAGYDGATLAGDLAAVDTAQIEAYLHPLTDGLQVTGKERFLAGLVQVAMAGGTLTADQRQIIDRSGRVIGLTPAHVSGIVSTVVADRSPGQVPPTVDPPAGGPAGSF